MSAAARTVTPRPAASPRAIVVLAAVAVFVVAVDQLIKQFVVSNMVEGERIEVLGHALQWHFVRNPGAAFSMASGMTWIFTLVAVIVAGFIVANARRIRSLTWAIVLGAVLGGTVGNLIDRIVREPKLFEGHVIDYISTPWLMPAIYNFADIGIVLGMLSVVALTVFDIGFDGVRGKDRAVADSGEDGTGTAPELDHGADRGAAQ